jgi:hypothetical protein
MAELNTQPNWDPSQFKLQLDGTFRISIRGMAAMAGVDDGGLARSLKTAADENPLPCARSLVAQGFYPADVSTWGETGGIPEDAAPFILEHYGITATSPSALARQVLLSFSRVGINAYLKERLGVSQVRDTQPTLSPEQHKLEWLMQFTAQHGIEFDDRDRLQIKNYAFSLALPPAGGAQTIYNDYPLSRLIPDIFGVVLENKQLSAIGKLMAKMWREVRGEEPPRHDQYVDGAVRLVAHYPKEEAVPMLKAIRSSNPELFIRSK